MSTVFDDIIASIPAQKAATSPSRLTTPTYKGSAVASPPLTSYESAPLSYKADINSAKGEITSHCAIWLDPTTGQKFCDSYLDIVESGSFKSTIADLERNRRYTKDPYLIPFLHQHDRKEIIGGIKSIEETSLGVLYTAKVSMQVQRAREDFALVEARMLTNNSYGYDPIKFWYENQQQKGIFDDQGDRIRHLIELALKEISLVTFGANPHARVLDAKSRFYVPAQYGKIAALTGQMNKSFDALESQLKSMHSDFPALPGDEYVGTGESDITNLLSQIQKEMR